MNTATAPDSKGEGINNAQVIPVRELKRFPPRIDQGCANGLEGTANSRVEDAPIGAMSHKAFKFEPAVVLLINPTTNIPISAPKLALNFSLKLRFGILGIRYLNMPLSSII